MMMVIIIAKSGACESGIRCQVTLGVSPGIISIEVTSECASRACYKSSLATRSG